MKTTTQTTKKTTGREATIAHGVRTMTTSQRAARDQKNREEMQAAFVRKLAEVREALEAIQGAVDDHLGYDPDAINWGHVGDAARILETLREARRVACHEAE